MQNSLCVQVLRSPILAALLHGTPAAGSAKLCGMVEGMELRNFRRGRHLYSAWRPSRWASAHILVYFLEQQSESNCKCTKPVIMAALHSRCGHYIFALWFLSFFLLHSSFLFLDYSQRSEIGCLPYFYTWCGLCANLECMSEMCCTRLAGNTERKMSQKIAICAPSNNFVRLHLRS